MSNCLTPVIMPLIKQRLQPINLAEDIIGVQPMTEQSANIFTLKVNTGPEPQPKEGELRHSFLYGWQRYYGTQWIDAAIWLKIKICGL